MSTFLGFSANHPFLPECQCPATCVAGTLAQGVLASTCPVVGKSESSLPASLLASWPKGLFANQIQLDLGGGRS